MDSIKVIIWGIDDVNTLGVVREMGENGIDFLFLVKGEAKFASKSRYVNKIKHVTSNEEGLAFLLKTYSPESIKPILISTGDGVSIFIDQHREELEPYFILPTTATKGFVEKYSDKYVMTQLAMDFGIPCPKSFPIKWNSSIDDIEYPCLIKPSHQKPGHYNEFKYKVCNTRKELENTLSHVRHDSEFIVQEYIRADNDLVIYGVRLKDKSTLYAGSIRGYHRACGICSYGYISKDIPNSVDTEKLTSFLDYIDYTGPFGFDFGEVDGIAFFYEINLRNDGTCHCFYQAGAKLLIAYIYSCAGIDYSQLGLIPRSCWFIDEIHDIENVLERKTSYKDWKKAYDMAEIYRYYKADDLAPWIYVRRRKWMEVIKYVILNKYRLQIVSLFDKLGLRK